MKLLDCPGCEYPGTGSNQAYQFGKHLTSAYFYEGITTSSPQCFHTAHPLNWIGDLLRQFVANLAATGQNGARNIGNQWDLRLMPGQTLHHRSKRGLHRSHQRGMKGASYRQTYYPYILKRAGLCHQRSNSLLHARNDELRLGVPVGDRHIMLTRDSSTQAL